MKQAIDSATSYAVGGAGIAVGSLAEIASTAQAFGIIIGCVVVIIRLIHDSIKLYRYWRSK